MRTRSRCPVASRSLHAAAVLLLLTGCERGCLRKQVDHVRDEQKNGSFASALANAVDCPDGLARCVDGTVEVSRLSSYDVPCTASPERCACPWDRMAACERGCAAETAVLAIPKDRAEAQLCASPAGSPIAGPPPANGALDAVTASSCDGERYRCDHGSVIACDPSSRRLAVCTLGCAVEGATLDEAPVTDHDAVDVLCLHPR